MKQTIYRYPHFIANSVLKSKNLNDSFGYLDEQSRILRAECQEIGIISGLTFAISNGRILINPGKAVNSRGWYAFLEHQTAYEYAVRVSVSTSVLDSDSLTDIISQGGSLVGFVCFRTREEALEFSPEPVPVAEIRNLESMALALACGKRNLSLASCSEISCNVNSEEMRHEIWPVLVYTSGKFRKEDASAKNQETLTIAPNPLFQRIVSVSRPNGARRLAMSSGMLNRIVFRKTIMDWFLLLKKDATALVDTVVKEIIDQGGEAWTAVLGDYQSLRNRLLGSRRKVIRLLDGNRADHVESRYLLFLRDYCQALTELIEDYNDFATRYGILPRRKVEGCLLYLGSTSSLDGDGCCLDITYRSLILPKDDRFPECCRRLRDLLERVCLLSEHFSTSGVNQKNCPATDQVLRATIGAASGRISDRPLPPYYQEATSEAFMRCWNADRLTRSWARTPYPHAKENELVYLRDTDRIYLNGYEGRRSQDVSKYLMSLSRNYSLGLKVRILDLENRRLKKGIASVLGKAFPTPYIVSVVYDGKKNAVNSESTNHYRLFDAFHEYFVLMGKPGVCRQTFLNDLGRLTLGEQFASKEQYEAFRSGLGEVDSEDIREFCRCFFDKSLYDYQKSKNKDIRNHAVTNAVDTFVRMVRRSSQDEIEGAVLGSGIPAGSTVYLLTIHYACIGYAVHP